MLTLKHTRQLKDLSCTDLAELLCVSPSTVSRWERGKSRPDAGKLHDLAGALGVTAKQAAQWFD